MGAALPKPRRRSASSSGRLLSSEARKTRLKDEGIDAQAALAPKNGGARSSRCYRTGADDAFLVDGDQFSSPGAVVSRGKHDGHREDPDR